MDVEAALRSLDAEGLRAFVGEALDAMEPHERGPMVDALLRRAAAHGSYRPAPPPLHAADEAIAFVTAARRVAYADAGEFDEYLRRGITASLAGDHATARRILEALLVPIAEAEIDLGQHEMVDEVLSVDLHDCVARYLLAVYLETPSASPAHAVLAATEQLSGLGALVEPVRAMEEAFGRPLPDVQGFLDAWIHGLQASKRPAGDYESEADRWLREAVGRRDGTEGLAKMARATKRPETVSAWCRAVAAEGDWRKSLAACEEAALLVTSGFWRGEFLDGAAFAASKLGRKDVTKRLEAAWVGAPALARLLRWLASDEADAAVVRKRASAALDDAHTKSKRLTAFLHALVGDVGRAARALKTAPGLGWSSDDHPGHLVFPMFVWMLAEGTPKGLSAAVADALNRPPQSLLEWDGPSDSGKLSTPTVLDVLQRAEVSSRGLSAKDRSAVLDAMKEAASKRTDGVTGAKRRRHYEHAAILVACCVEADRAGSTGWLETLRARTSRFSAFQEELRTALDGGHGRYVEARSVAHGE